jgi:hypothetical protein
MRRPIAATLILAAVFSLGACVTDTPYRPATNGPGTDGYSETPVEPGRWIVAFSGNAETSRRTVEGYLLRRSAELTLEQGYDWFTIGQHASAGQSEPHAATAQPLGGAWSPDWRYRDGALQPWRPWNPWGSPPPAAGAATAWAASAEIVMGRGARPAGGAAVYDARALAPAPRRR